MLGRGVVFKDLEPNTGDRREARGIFNHEGWENLFRVSYGWGWFFSDLLRNWDDFFSNRSRSAAMKNSVILNISKIKHHVYDTFLLCIKPFKKDLYFYFIPQEFHLP